MICTMLVVSLAHVLHLGWDVYDLYDLYESALARHTLTSVTRSTVKPCGVVFYGAKNMFFFTVSVLSKFVVCKPIETKRNAKHFIKNSWVEVLLLLYQIRINEHVYVDHAQHTILCCYRTQEVMLAV